MKFASGRSVSGATVDQEKGVGMDRWEYKIAGLTKAEKDIGEVGVRFVHPIALLKSLRSPLRGGPFRAENGGPVAC
jgi:hypothetical protein